MYGSFGGNATVADWQQLGQTLVDPGPFRRFGNQVHLSFNGNVLAAQTVTGVRLFRFDEATTSWLAYGGEDEIACRPNEPTWGQPFFVLVGRRSGAGRRWLFRRWYCC
mmetsp:Transcript_3482/g.6936  ORF Transcript_3482/g.6936 Transcript_3482/m.6936 type:complete len:108 (-) Transcript_3482:134-457(-)